MNDKPIPIKANEFYNIAETYRKHLTEEENIESIDMTQLFYAELEEQIKKGEIIIININAKVRGGKSTEALALANDTIHKLLIKHKKLPKNDRFGMKNIARDDQEYSKIMRNTNTQNTIIVTDENNELEATGENVTAENALKKVFSDVQAGRYVHRICCSPKETVDPNADILLSLIAVDKNKGISRNKLYYKYYEGGTEYTQLLGYVDINVNNTIKEWRKIEPIFLKRNKTKQEEKTIEQASKKDWYVEYMIKKYEKMKLITEEGIFRPRILDYAQLILNVIKELKPLAENTEIVDPNIVKNFVKMQFREAKIPTSILGEELVVREAQGILTLYKGHKKITKQLKKAIEKHNEEETKQLVDTQNILSKAIELQTKELEHYVKVNQKYHEKNT